MERTVPTVGVLDKAVGLLRAVVAEPRSLAELVEATGTSRATTHRLASALVAHGLMRRDDQGRYAPGLDLVAMGRAALDSVPLAGAAARALALLRDVTGESVQLYVRQGDTRVCVAALESPHGLRTIVPLGAALPLDVGSAGHLLAGDGSASLTGPGGWRATVGERELGVASVSAPVRDASGSIVAAISVSGPVDRTGPEPGERYGTAVVDAARMVESALGRPL
jgi:DNA-binding IclR family transcriptional regulator